MAVAEKEVVNAVVGEGGIRMGRAWCCGGGGGDGGEAGGWEMVAAMAGGRGRMRMRGESFILFFVFFSLGKGKGGEGGDGWRMAGILGQEMERERE